MEPQDTPPYAPLPNTAATPASEPAPVAPPPRNDTARDESARTRRTVAMAAGGAFVAAMAGMAIARSGSSSASTTSTTPAGASPSVTVPQPSSSTFDDDDDGFGGPRAAQPGTPSFADGGQTQSRGS